jgi:hypothetical protein
VLAAQTLHHLRRYTTQSINQIRCVPACMIRVCVLHANCSLARGAGFGLLHHLQPHSTQHRCPHSLIYAGTRAPVLGGAQQRKRCGLA